MTKEITKPVEYAMVHTPEFYVAGDLRAAYKYLKEHFNRAESEDKVEKKCPVCGETGVCNGNVHDQFNRGKSENSEVGE